MTGPKHIVLSGASRGLGARLAQDFAAPGVRLFLTARGAPALAEVAAACRARGADVTVFARDITDAPALAAALAEFEAGGAVDVVIANAGTSAGTGLDGAPEDAEAAARVVAVNLIGAINLVAPLLPGMRARRAGRIGLVASVAGFRGLPDYPAYCASKAGLIGWGQGLRAALGPLGVRVTIIAPGFFDSAMGDRFHGHRVLLMDQVAVAARVRQAVLAGSPGAAFPWPLALGLRLLALLPARFGDWAVRRARYRITPEA